VLRKLLWYLAGGSISERQWRDVVEVLHVSGAAMDDGYLERWANQLGLSELLQKARAESARGNHALAFTRGGPRLRRDARGLDQKARRAGNARSSRDAGPGAAAGRGASARARLLG
jgi:hypothetical protein